MIRINTDELRNDEDPPTDDDDALDMLPARMINEYVYCPRLFYLMHVEGQFAPNQYTLEGDAVHKRVDAKTDALASPIAKDATENILEKPAQQSLFCLDEQHDGSGEHNPFEADAAVVHSERVQREPTAIPKEEFAKPILHARSVTLASDRLGVVAKLDLVQAEGLVATPIDYKRGRPKLDDSGNLTAWKPERVQMCLQALVLRDNGFECNEAILYFHSTRQRVTIPIDAELIDLTQRMIEGAKRVAQQSALPIPLLDSPKCPKCSLSSICLPDETNRCRSIQFKAQEPKLVRLPTTPRDDLKPLYLNKQGLMVGKTSEVLQIKDQGRVIQEVRLREINQVNLFGNIQVSTQALQTLLEMEIPVVLFSQRGYFQGMLQGTGLKNILLRREQFRLADDIERCLRIAKDLVQGKILNQRVLLMRNDDAPQKDLLIELKRLSRRVEQATNLASLLGIEGNAARIYFQRFSHMLKPGDSPYDPCNENGTPPRFAFNFRGRNRRPPRDPVNAMLSLCYTLLAKDFTVAAASVGLDPYLGFFHQVRPGRPALSLDLMEPFRSLIADSTVITAVNNRMVYPEHFVAAGNGVTMTEPGRKAIFRAYEQRMDQMVTHPMFDYRVSYRRMLEIQTRLLGRVISGELNSYPVFVTR